MQKIHQRKKKKMVGSFSTNFLGNPGGFSIMDFLSIIFATAFLILTSIITYKIFYGRETKETIEMAMNVLKVLLQPMLIILGGYFGDQMVIRYMDNKQYMQYMAYRMNIPGNKIDEEDIKK